MDNNGTRKGCIYIAFPVAYVLQQHTEARAHRILQRMDADALLFRCSFALRQPFVRYRNPPDACRTLLAEAFAWACNGFGSYHAIAPAWAAIADVVGAWLMPPKTRKVRESPALWAFLCGLSIVLGLGHMVHAHSRRHFLRVIARAVPPDVQKAILFRQFDSRWRQWLRRCFATLWDPPSASKAAVYLMFCTQNRCWYVGRAQGQRTRNGLLWSGVVARFREHLQNTADPMRPQGHRERYRCWRGVPMHGLFFLPGVWSSAARIDALEAMAIRVLQAPTQQPDFAATATRARPSGFRAYPRHRARPPLDREPSLNLLHRLRCSPAAFSRYQCAGATFEDYVAWYQKVYGLPRCALLRRLYQPAYAFILALYLAVPQHRLVYSCLLRSPPNPIEAALRVWSQASFLDAHRCRRVRQKIQRFFAKGKYLPVRNLTLRVPAATKGCLSRLRRLLRCFAHFVGERTSPLVKAYIRTKLSVVFARAPTVEVQLTDQISAAREFQLQRVLDLSPADKARYQQRLDVARLPVHAKLPGYDDVGHTYQLAESFLRRCVASMGFQDAPLGEWMRRCKLPHSYGEDAARELAQYVRGLCPGKVLVPLDRDTRRRVAMDAAGYEYRLWQGYIADTKFYRRDPNASLEAVARWRLERIREYLPASWAPRDIPVATLARGYHNYKGKCLSASGAAGLVCGKDHAHEREVVSSFHDPLKVRLRVTSRALRLAKRLSHEPSWTLWSQGDLAAQLQSRVGALQWDQQYIRRCPCGLRKDTPLQCIKTDASQFFKSASACRGIRRARQLFARLRSRKHAAGVCVRRSQRASGYLLTSAKKVSRQFTLVTWREIEQVLQFCAGDTAFVVGDCVLHRAHGWAMGASISEPVTQVDLQEDVYQLHKDPRVLARTGWAHRRLPVDQIVTGLTHVDDMVIFSKIWCASCLERGSLQLFPHDVGMQKEEQGPQLRFLHAQLSVSADVSACPVVIQPYNPNGAFARGEADSPALSRLAPFAGALVTSPASLRVFVWAMVCQWDRVVQGSAAAGFDPIVELSAEIILLWWPPVWLGRTYIRIHRRHDSEFVQLCRRAGKLLRRTTFSDLEHLRDVYPRIRLCFEMALQHIHRDVVCV